jgi:hypothetical protein
VALLKQKFLAADDSVDLMNAGVCGSDPFENYMNFKNRLQIYKPQLIIQTLTTTDITTDSRLCGGMERFQENETVKYKAAPWWEPLYAFSYISRLFFKMAGYNELLQNFTLRINIFMELPIRSCFEYIGKMYCEK